MELLHVASSSILDGRQHCDKAHFSSVLVLVILLLLLLPLALLLQPLVQLMPPLVLTLLYPASLLPHMAMLLLLMRSAPAV